MNPQVVLLGIIFLLLCAAILRIAFKAGKQWNSPKREYEAQMEDIRRRKRELGIDEDD